MVELKARPLSKFYVGGEDGGNEGKRRRVREGRGAVRANSIIAEALTPPPSSESEHIHSNSLILPLDSRPLASGYLISKAHHLTMECVHSRCIFPALCVLLDIRFCDRISVLNLQLCDFKLMKWANTKSSGL